MCAGSISITRCAGMAPAAGFYTEWGALTTRVGHIATVTALHHHRRHRRMHPLGIWGHSTASNHSISLTNHGINNSNSHNKRGVIPFIRLMRRTRRQTRLGTRRQAAIISSKLEQVIIALLMIYLFLTQARHTTRIMRRASSRIYVTRAFLLSMALMGLCAPDYKLAQSCAMDSIFITCC